MEKLNKKQMLNFVKYVAKRENKKLTKVNLKVWSDYLKDFNLDVADSWKVVKFKKIVTAVNKEAEWPPSFNADGSEVLN